MAAMMRRRTDRPDRVTLDLMRPVLFTGRAFFPLAALVVVVFGLYVYTFYIQVTQGHGAATGQSTPVGAVWGLYVASIVFFIGISHVGIGVSAATRLLNLHYLRPYARVAELLTLFCLPAAVLIITLDIGRPERFLINVMIYGRIQAPFVWSATVISVYLFASLVYLYLSMRRDLALSARYVPRWGWLYRLLALGYEDTEEARELHEKVLWWMALVLIPIMVSVHSVYGFVFGLHGGRPGWFNPFMAPYFVLGALINGFATLVAVVAIIRKLYHWEEYLPVEAIRNLARFLCWMTAIYIYFMGAEYLTYIYSPPAGEVSVARSVLKGEFSLIFWPAMGTLVLGWLLLFLNQTIFNRQFTLWVTVVGACLINIVLFATRYLIVVPSLLRPLLPFPTGTYTPTLYEWGAFLGVAAFVVGAYTLFLKVFPIIELPHSSELEERR
ncbi:MAG: NrfD/PsrC family molybdoenzyme membrane anchor subunit [Dehalococcoidales bacterium]|nr:NrfD/PsrC family molybdoenzyme membrane anchor subunit [Dehalococcoidales bacterium]